MQVYSITWVPRLLGDAVFSHVLRVTVQYYIAQFLDVSTELLSFDQLLLQHLWAHPVLGLLCHRWGRWRNKTPLRFMLCKQITPLKRGTSTRLAKRESETRVVLTCEAEQQGEVGVLSLSSLGQNAAQGAQVTEAGSDLHM